MPTIAQNIRGPIGVFDSGYGGLTVLKGLKQTLPEYDFLYLGDNARAPYGPRSYELVYQFTLEAVKTLFDRGCPLIVLACNTASAKALRVIQQNDLPKLAPNRRILGVIRPTAEIIGDVTKTRHVGILATSGTIDSNSYPLEMHKLNPDIVIHGQACPMWVPLVENHEYSEEGADYFVKKYVDELMAKDPQIDTIILGCTHYPLLLPKIRKYAPANVQVIAQEHYVAESLKNYLARHPELDNMCSKTGLSRFLTSESTEKFEKNAELFLGVPIKAERIN